MAILSFLPRNSPIHELDIRTKFLAFLFIFPITAFISEYVILFVLILTVITIAICSRLGIRIFWNSSKYFLIFSIIIIAPIYCSLSEGSLFNMALQAFILILRLSILILSGIIYALTTNPNEMPQAMMAMHVPHRYGILLMLGFRLYPYMVNRMTNISHAIKSRGIYARVSFFHISKTIKSLGLYIIPFILATLQIGFQLGETMLTRGYDPFKPITISQRIRMRSNDYLILTFSSFLLILSIFKILFRFPFRIIFSY